MTDTSPESNKDKLLMARAYFESDIDRIGDWCVGDIRRCCRLRTDNQSYEDGGSMIGAFILWVCALDYLGGLLTNSDFGSRRIKSFLTYLNRLDITRKYGARSIVKMRGYWYIIILLQNMHFRTTPMVSSILPYGKARRFYFYQR